MKRQYFGTDGVRGPYGGALMNESLAWRLGAGVAAWVKLTPDFKFNRVFIGRDTRASGPALEAALAAGLASEGYHVFTYSIANFPTLRCFEQIRNDICYHHLPVTIVSVGAGMSYGNLGYSHHALQDIGVMRTLPEMTILSPADPREALEAVRWLAANPCPSYLRIGKAGEPDLRTVGGLADGPLHFIEGDGRRMAVVGTGAILGAARDAAALLKIDGINIDVFSCPWLQPVSPAFFKSLEDFSQIIVLEEHLDVGGLGSILRDNLRGPQIISAAVPASVLGQVGAQKSLRAKAGLDAQSLAAKVKGLLGR